MTTWRSARAGLESVPVRLVRAVRSRRTAARALSVVLVALVGATVALLLDSPAPSRVGPVETSMSVRPAMVGDTVVEIPPLGSLTLDSHDAPFRFAIDVRRLDPESARRIFTDPAYLQGLERTVVTDVRSGLLTAGLRAGALAVAGAFVLGLVLFRRIRRAALCAAVAVAAVAVSGAAAAATWNPRSVVEPRFDGLLSSAPTLVGSAESIVGNFDRYRDQLAKIVERLRAVRRGARTPVGGSR